MTPSGIALPSLREMEQPAYSTDDFTIQIWWKLHFDLIWIIPEWSDHCKILHMSQQFCCCDMCKICSDLTARNWITAKTNFRLNLFMHKFTMIWLGIQNFISTWIFLLFEKKKYLWNTSMLYMTTILIHHYRLPVSLSRHCYWFRDRAPEDWCHQDSFNQSIPVIGIKWYECLYYIPAVLQMGPVTMSIFIYRAKFTLNAIMIS